MVHKSQLTVMVLVFESQISHSVCLTQAEGPHLAQESGGPITSQIARYSKVFVLVAVSDLHVPVCAMCNHIRLCSMCMSLRDSGMCVCVCVCVCARARAKVFCVLLSKDTITHLRVQLGPQAAKINFSKLYHID